LRLSWLERVDRVGQVWVRVPTSLPFPSQWFSSRRTLGISPYLARARGKRKIECIWTKPAEKQKSPSPKSDERNARDPAEPSQIPDPVEKLRKNRSRQRSARLDFRGAKARSQTKVKKCAENPRANKPPELASRLPLRSCSVLEKSTASTGCATMTHALDCSTGSALRSFMRNHRREDLVRGFR